MFGLQFSLTPKKRHKLRREPLKFFVDAIRNRAAVVTSLAQRSITYLPVSGFLHSERRYTAIAAVYNVESYLEKFFVSMASQTLSFSDHIELIMVDDGSTDASAQIIERWRRRFPQTIRYLYKENGGQASARNLGLQYATGDWVTFVDPDDFVHFRYFEAVDRFLKQYETERIGMLCCKWVFFHEKGNRYVDDHPLNFRFDHGSYAALFHPRAEVVLSSAARSFFRAETVAREGIRFDESLRPRFEDGDFSARYALKMENERVGYVADAIYYYRKRSDGSSTLDRDWEDPDRFGVVVERGYLKLLRDTDRELGVVPLSIQWLVLYDLIWLYKKVIDDEASISFLTDEQKGRLRELLFEVFEYLDSDHIMNFEIAGCSFFHRVGFLGLYKQEDPPVQIAYVEGYDGTKNLALLKWFCPGEPATECFCVNGVEVIPAYAKVRVHDFLSDVFVNERRAWVRLGEGASSLSLEVDGKPVTIAVEGVSFDHGVIRTEIEQLIQARRSEVTPNVVAMGFRRLARSRRVEARFRDAWLLLDRDKQADDNAEHLYRHIMRNHPEINAFFVLKKSSHDWERLETEGFRLIAFGSRDHHLLMLNAKHVVSSHIDSFVVNVLPWKWYGDMFTYKFTFLQHGVIRDDISRWLNGKRIDLFVTSSPGEHESIAGDVSRYKFGRLQTRMVGLARHDALIERTEKTEKVILIMPTWRSYLVSAPAHGTSTRFASEAFAESSYAREWRALLHSDRLRELAARHGYQVVFFPHSNMQLYADWFDAPHWVDVKTHESEPVLHKLYRRAAVMITDYSSVFFEMGLLDKPVIYYQFDHDEMYGGAHPSVVGYFDFERDGFGPVTIAQDELLAELATILERDCQAAPDYLRRMHEALPLRDGQNRARTVQAIKALDSSEIVDGEAAAIATGQRV